MQLHLIKATWWEGITHKKGWPEHHTKYQHTYIQLRTIEISYYRHSQIYAICNIPLPVGAGFSVLISNSFFRKRLELCRCGFSENTWRERGHAHIAKQKVGFDNTSPSKYSLAGFCAEARIVASRFRTGGVFTRRACIGGCPSPLACSWVGSR